MKYSLQEETKVANHIKPSEAQPGIYDVFYKGRLDTFKVLILGQNYGFKLHNDNSIVPIDYFRINEMNNFYTFVRCRQSITLFFDDEN